MIPDFMPEKLIISFEEYLDTVEKLSVEITNNFKPTVLVGIMRGAAPIIDILSCLLYTSPSPRDVEESRMPSSA